MSLLLKIIKKFYPLTMMLSKLTGVGIKVTSNTNKMQSKVNFYNLQAQAINGDVIKFESLTGKKILIVNLASQCGYTPQYREVEELYKLYKDKLIILGFPSNDFGNQEPGTDAEIEQFCKISFGVTFPVFQKDHVKGKNKQPVYKWLCNADKNGWNDKEPAWNFYKYLIDEEGNLDKIFPSSVSPHAAINK